jgi:hypothetical protein
MKITRMVAGVLTLVLLLGASQPVAAQEQIIDRVEPVAPTVGQDFRVWLRSRDPFFFFADPIVTVQGGTIRIDADVTFSFAVPGPPRPEFHYAIADVPPLPAGTYTVELYVFLLTRPGDPPQLRDSIQLAIGAAQPEVIPATSDLALGVLALALLAVGFGVRRRVRR